MFVVHRFLVDVSRQLTLYQAVGCTLFDSTVTEEILSRAVRCIQYLGLNGGSNISIVLLKDNNFKQANYAYWVVYCLEKQHAICKKTFSVSFFVCFRSFE